MIGPVAAPAAPPFGQAKTQVQQEYVQQRYDAYLSVLARKASVGLARTALAALPVN